MQPSVARPLTNGRISYLFIKVHDVDQMLAFYRNTLGFDVVYSEVGVCAFLRLGGTGPQLAFYPGRQAVRQMAVGLWPST